MNQTNERELGWDDEIQKDGGEFIVLPAGDYNFTVTKFERGRFGGSPKMPACNQAKLEITVHSPEHGDVTVFHNLFLHTKTEGLISNFFTGIGLKKKGEAIKPPWQQVVGRKGRLKLEINKFTGNDGIERTNNQVKTFYAYEDVFGAKNLPEPPPAYQQAKQGYQPQQQQQPFPTAQAQHGGWSNGQF